MVAYLTVRADGLLVPIQELRASRVPAAVGFVAHRLASAAALVAAALST